MTEYTVTMQAIPEISEEERHSRLWRAYQIILECARQTEDEESENQSTTETLDTD